MSAKDEFLRIRLAKFSKGRNENDEHIILKNNQPFTGTIIKEKGVITPFRILDVSLNEHDESYFEINYKLGKFCGKYFYENKTIKVHFNFSDTGKPTGKCYVVFKDAYQYDNNTSRYESIIPISPNFLPSSHYLEVYGGDIGKYNFQNHWSSRIANTFFESNSISRFVSNFTDAWTSIDCDLQDTMFFTYEKNRLIDLNFKNTCNYTVKFDRDDFLKEIPVTQNSLLYNGVGPIDYERFIFTEYENIFYGGWMYYYCVFVDRICDYNFYSSLDKLPKYCEVSTEDFQVRIEYDIPKIIKSAKKIINNDPKSWPYQNCYDIGSPKIKSLKLKMHKKDKKINTKYINHEGNYYFETKVAGDTKGTLIMSGNLNTGIIDSIYYNFSNVKPGVDPYYGLEFYLFKKAGDNKYTLEKKGWLGDMEKVYIEAKLIKEYDRFKLINHGIARFTDRNQNTKTYKYINGEIVID